MTLQTTLNGALAAKGLSKPAVVDGRVAATPIRTDGNIFRIGSSM